MSGQRGYPIIIIQRVFLVTTAVTFLLLCYYMSDCDNGEWRQQQPARRDAAIPFASPEQNCRALFSITSVHRHHSLREVDTSRNSVNNRTFSEGLSGKEWRVIDSAVTSSGGKSSVAATRVRHLLRKRDSPAGVSTDDYYSLAALLPKLLVFGDSESGERVNHTKYSNDEDMNQGQWKNEESKLKPPFFRRRSRVGAGGDVLPYVPCTVAPYDHPANFTACVNRRLQRKPRLWLCLMGDSKIRYLFNELLTRTDDEFHYAVQLLDRIMSWPDVKKNIHPFVWTDMKATSQTEPRLRITFRFRRFGERRPILFNSTQELMELQRWASGAEPTPDLLVVGYTSWMMQREELWNDEENHYPQDILDFLLQMHRAVVPLLEQIGQRTRVLVLPQSRLRPHSYSTPNIRAAFSHYVFEWSEMTFLHLLRRYRAGGALHQMVWDNQEHGDKQGTQGAIEQTTNSTDDPEPHGAKDQTMAEEDDSRRPLRATVRGRTPRDHLVPTRSSSGVWWWDSSLPLNLAGIMECEELYRRGFASHPAFQSRLLHCLDSQHAGTITNTDLVTMLFNLICNTYLDLDTSNCCS